MAWVTKYKMRHYRFNQRNIKNNRGFTVFELLIAVAIMGVLVSLAIPAYDSYATKRNYAKATGDIIAVSQKIDNFYAINRRFPTDLAEIGLGNFIDPWGGAYGYLNIKNADPNVKIQPRKDKVLKPVNSDYDVYCIGKDGITSRDFNNPASFDDIVRASNGRYVGLAGEY
jgi:general secretion pathway protein G